LLHPARRATQIQQPSQRTAGRGTNFAVFSETADRIDLCLFAADGDETVVPLPERTAQVWHGYAPAVGPGQRYGFRAHGAFDPAAGLRTHPSKLLLDPYATAVQGEVQWSEDIFTYRHDDPEGPVNDADSGPGMPRAVVTSPFFDWDNDCPPRTPWNEAMLYELQVKGFTQRHPGIPEEQRGTYAGLGHPAAIDYLTELGVTAVELLPVSSPGRNAIRPAGRSRSRRPVTRA
jgi:isoamylase